MNYILGKVGEPTRKIAGAVYVYENAVPNWQEIIEGVEKEIETYDSGVSYARATTIDGNWEGRRKNLTLGISLLARQGNETCRNIHNYFGILLSEHLMKYSADFETTFGVSEDFNLLKYSGTTNDHYDAHYDGGVNNRWISAILYLNDDYEGGELEFVVFGEKIKPKAGTLVIFPSNYAYTHVAHSVTEGTKYAIVTWITGE